MTISEEMRNVGWFLLDKLNLAQFSIDAMFWSDFDEGDFRLYLATPLVDSSGTLFTYELLGKIFAENHLDSEWGFAIYEVTLIGLKHPKLAEIRQRYGSVPPDRKWVRRVSLSSGGAYVYFLK
ncbi:hypothetical protein [Armatimonas sp.]|uniref:hypothetical protein n=1 Tax=Armatimonas sp. TaxID=1872638 RepID=UPI003751BBDE